MADLARCKTLQIACRRIRRWRITRNVVLVVHQADPDIAPNVPVLVLGPHIEVPGLLDRLICRLEHQPMLGIRGRHFSRAPLEELVVECIVVVDEVAVPLSLGVQISPGSLEIKSICWDFRVLRLCCTKRSPEFFQVCSPRQLARHPNYSNCLV